MIAALIERKRLAILKALLEKKKLYLNEISKASGVPPATSMRILKELNKYGIVKIEVISRLKLYYIDPEKAKSIESLLSKDKDPLTSFVELASKEQGVQSIVLHGRDEEKANVLLLGININSENIKILASKTKEKYGFSISYMMLTHEQFSQMKELNLFKGKLEELYKGTVI